MLKVASQVHLPRKSDKTVKRGAMEIRTFKMRGRTRRLNALLALVLCLLLVGCDCAEEDTTSAFGPDCGTSTGDAADPDSPGDSGSGSGTLMFSDVGANALRRFKNISTLDSTSVTEPAVTGNLTRMTRPQYLALDPTSSDLVVCDEGSIAVLFFAEPLKITGNAPPARILTGPATELVAPVQAYVDSDADELYVLDRGANRILVYPSASTINGEVAPIRRIEGPSTLILNPAAFIVRPSIDQLTVINPTQVLTFTDFRSINGDRSPSGRVSGQATGFLNLTYGLYDSANGLLLGDRGSKSLLYFSDFDIDRNNQAPTRVINGGNTRINEPGQFVLTGSGNLYLANGADVLVFDGVSELQGNPFPNRRFSATDPVNQTIRGLLAL